MPVIRNWTLVMDANKDCPLCAGMEISVEEMRCMMQMHTIDIGSIVSRDGQRHKIVKGRRGGLVMRREATEGLRKVEMG